MPRKFLLFDFDGVIANSFNEAFSVTKMFLPELDHETYRDLFMGNVFEKIAEKKPAEKQHSDEVFSEKYFQLTKNMGVIPGVKKVILELAKEHHMSVISSAYSYIIKDVLERENLLHHFGEILGSDVETNKSKKIQMVFDKHGAVPNQTLFITDTVGDVLEARKVSVDSIAVSWGFHGVDRLILAKPKAIVDTPEALLVAIKND